MNTPFEEEVPLVDKNPRLDSSSDLSDLSDMDCSDQDLGGQPSSPAASAPHDGRNTGDTTMMDVAITSPADEATITPPAPVDARKCIHPSRPVLTFVINKDQQTLTSPC